jgi:hypothetical protein
MTEDCTISDDILRFWTQRFNTVSIAKFTQLPEHLVERLLHAEMERRRQEQVREETVI